MIIIPRLRYLGVQAATRHAPWTDCDCFSVWGEALDLDPQVRGTRGSLPEGTSQPDDPDGVGGFSLILFFYVSFPLVRVTLAIIYIACLFTCGCAGFDHRLDLCFGYPDKSS